MPVYVPNFKHDIFVSYSHADNQIIEGADKGWVTTFVRLLSIELGKQLGREDAYSLWLDERALTGNESVTPDIDEQLNNCAVFLFILSPAYLASEWCILELNTFLSTVNEDTGRIFMIENSFIPYEDKLPEFQELLGYQFWIKDVNTNINRTLAIPKPNPDREPEYYQNIHLLASQITKKLKELKQASATETDEDTLATLDRLQFENEKAHLDGKKAGKVKQLKSISTAMARPNVPTATIDRLKKQFQQLRIDIDDLDGQIGQINAELAKLKPISDSTVEENEIGDLATLDKLQLENERKLLHIEKKKLFDKHKKLMISLSTPNIPELTRDRLNNQLQQLRLDVDELDGQIAQVETKLSDLESDSVINIEPEVVDLATLDKLHLENERARFNTEKAKLSAKQQSIMKTLRVSRLPELTRTRHNNQLRELRTEIEKLDAKIADIDRKLGPEM